MPSKRGRGVSLPPLTCTSLRQTTSRVRSSPVTRHSHQEELSSTVCRAVISPNASASGLLFPSEYMAPGMPPLPLFYFAIVGQKTWHILPLGWQKLVNVMARAFLAALERIMLGMSNSVRGEQRRRAEMIAAQSGRMLSALGRFKLTRFEADVMVIVGQKGGIGIGAVVWKSVSSDDETCCFD